ncbi:MAG TPA: peptidoglycan DD-metalloendopeptidase family protein [Thermoanaerobacterales bacterium]|nr:peptidoglycan DD-metalloendopeptidase family protein [Thermoanaerobacterales bacterium]
MIVPHSGRSILSISIPIIILKIIGGLMAGIVAVAAIYAVNFSISYREMKASNQDLAVKARDYNKLQQQLDYFVKKTQTLEEKMQSLEKLDNDLRNLLKNDPALKKNIDLKQESYSTNYMLASRGDIDREKAMRDLQILESKLPQQEQSLKELKNAVIQRNQRLASTPSIWPVAGRITSDFGYRRSPFGSRREFHDGLDIAAPYGTPIRAAADGMVVFTGYRQGYGNMVTISHGYGIETSYGHTSKILVKRGQKVKKGQVIAKVGNTGRSTGPHVHYMVSVNGGLKNPTNYLQ